MTTTHNVHTREERPGKYRSACTCGAYRSRLYDFPGYAEKAGRAHQKAKR